ncbi:hypothetical protein EMIT0P228_90075 [Pseudomonas brassicacearum]
MCRRLREQARSHRGSLANAELVNSRNQKLWEAVAAEGGLPVTDFVLTLAAWLDSRFAPSTPDNAHRRSHDHHPDIAKQPDRKVAALVCFALVERPEITTNGHERQIKCTDRQHDDQENKQSFLDDVHMTFQNQMSLES